MPFDINKDGWPGHVGIGLDPFGITPKKRRDPGDCPLPGPKPFPPPAAINVVGHMPDLSPRPATGPDAVAKVYGQCIVEGRIIASSTEVWYSRLLVGFGAAPVDSIIRIIYTYADGRIANAVAPGSGENGVLLPWYDIHPAGGVPDFLEWYYQRETRTWPTHTLLSWVQPKWILTDSGQRALVSATLPAKFSAEVKGAHVYDPRDGAQDPADSSTWPWSRTASNCLLDFLTDPVDGCGNALALYDMASFAAAADVCDETVEGEPRYTLDMVIGSEGTSDDWVKKILFHMNGRLVVQESGLVGLSLDASTADTPIVLDGTNSRDFRIWPTARTEVPSQVTVEYPNAALNWALDKASEPTTELTAGTDTLREQIYRMEGIHTDVRAARFARYMLRRQVWAGDSAEGYLSPELAYLPEGTLFSLTASGKTAWACRLVLKELQDSGEIAATLSQYVAAVYTLPAGAPGTPPAPPAAPSDLVGWEDGTDYTESSVDGTGNYVSRTAYKTKKFDLPVGSVLSQLRVRVYKGGTYSVWPPTWEEMDPATNPLSLEVILPTIGNLAAETGRTYRLYCPVGAYEDFSALSHPLPWVPNSGGIYSGHIYCVRVKVEDVYGQLSDGLYFGQDHAYASGGVSSPNVIADGNLVKYKASNETLEDAGPVIADPLPHAIADGHLTKYQSSDGTLVDAGLAALAKPGDIKMWGGPAEAGWLLCDGSEVSRTTYADLYNAYGAGATYWPFGQGNGTTTFALPDMQGRFALGKATSGTGSTLGGTGGAIDHTHTPWDSPKTSGAPSASTVKVTADFLGVDVPDTAHTHDVAMSDTDVANPPFLAVNFVICHAPGGGSEGPIGATGADGNTVLSGASDPTGGVGVDGNFYIQKTDWKIFGPKASGTWPAGVSLVGTGSGSGDAIVIGVVQTAHGFAVGDVLRSAGTAGAYALAQADSAANAEVVGVVSAVADADNFTLFMAGDLATGVPAVAAGTVLFLSDVTAGLMTATEPTATGSVSKPLGVVTTSAVQMLVAQFRGVVIPAAAPSETLLTLKETVFAGITPASIANAATPTLDGTVYTAVVPTGGAIDIVATGLRMRGGTTLGANYSSLVIASGSTGNIGSVITEDRFRRGGFAFWTRLASYDFTNTSNTVIGSMDLSGASAKWGVRLYQRGRNVAGTPNTATGGLSCEYWWGGFLLGSPAGYAGVSADDVLCAYFRAPDMIEVYRGVYSSGWPALSAMTLVATIRAQAGAGLVAGANSWLTVTNAALGWTFGGSSATTGTYEVIWDRWRITTWE